MFLNSIPSISVLEAAQQITGDNVVLIDVRTPDEYASGHAKGTINIPLDSFNDADILKLKQYKNVYVICQSGGRSAVATKTLLEKGISAVSVAGGTVAWHSQGLPME